MSLKLVEMQVALPRTYEAGKKSAELEHRGQLLNDFAAVSVQLEEEKSRMTVQKQEQKEQANFQKDQESNGYFTNIKKKSSKKEEDQSVQEKHPYKGTYVDFNG